MTGGLGRLSQTSASVEVPQQPADTFRIVERDHVAIALDHLVTTVGQPVG
jgi:hypothetical protein